MNIAIIDCFSGISGDMTLAALIDCGVPQKYLRQELEKLKIPGYRLIFSRTQKHNISARQVQVRFDPRNQPDRRFNRIVSLLEKSALSPHVKEKSIQAFTILGKAESRIHGVPLDRVHFHEVGAVDSIVDIVGTFIAFDYLGTDEVYSVPVPLGSGFTQTAHGNMPVPSPAALKILEDYPVVYRDSGYEMTTPTGATIIKTLSKGTVAEGFQYQAQKTGYGAGTYDSDKWPNILRITLAEPILRDRDKGIIMLETNIDDMVPEMYSYLMEALFGGGALDVFYTSVMMKKNRPGTLVSVLCKEHQADRVEKILFSQSTTLGIRKYAVERKELQRRQKTISSEFGPIQVKMVKIGEKWLLRPEYETCREIAREYELSLPEVYRRITAISK